jgi:hypothetical protein
MATAISTSLNTPPSANTRRALRIAAAIVMALGIALRLRRYLQDRGVMHDEALLAGNVLANPLLAMFKPLKMGDQAAPVGFLIAEKMVTLALGSSEYVIRLVPLLAAIGSLFLFYRLAIRLLGQPAAIIGLAFMGLAEPLIYYAAEGKQYSTDVLCTLIVLCIATRPPGRSRSISLTAVGTILIWCSHPIIFVLAGIGWIWLWDSIRNRRSRESLAVAAMTATWLLSFMANYALVTSHYARNDYLTAYWLHCFAPLPVSGPAIRWYRHTLLDWFRFPLGFGKASPLALAAFIAGCCMLLKRKRAILNLCLFPLLIVVLASAAHRYPPSERLMLWAAPLLLLPMAFALGGTCGKGRSWLILRAGGCVALVIYPAYLAMKYTRRPPLLYDVKPALQYVRSHWQTGDVLYLHYGANVLTNYYLAARPWVGPDLVRPIEGTFPDGHPDRYQSDIDALAGQRRVWVLFAMSPEDKPLVDAALNRRGRRLDEARLKGSTAELYDLLP